MSGLINQLVEEIEGIMMKKEQKYAVVMVPSNDINNMKIVFSGNDKEKLKDRLLEYIIKKLSLEEYLQVEQLKGIFMVYLKSKILTLIIGNSYGMKKIINIPENINVEHFELDIYKDRVALRVVGSRVTKINYVIINSINL